ncbi:MAG: 30S ribosomal protein S7 [Proteobacteria bacterium]|nr:30S ribosomal protein S7 [Pseudomonadota bacterium]MCH9758607.1 30S ribosomal protein S7 [Pseudomonadota bacterium]
MSRRRVIAKRDILPDAKYGSVRVAKFINVIMTRGKKSVAERLVYGAMAEIEKKVKSDPLEILEQAINNVSPQVEVKSRRVGGANYQVPIEVRPVRAVALSMRWLRDSMRAGGDKSTISNLAQSLLEAADGRGSAMKKREDTHRMAAANKAFSHFRF